MISKDEAITALKAIEENEHEPYWDQKSMDFNIDILRRFIQQEPS